MTRVLLAFLSCAALVGAAPEASADPPPDPVVEVQEHGNGVYEVTATFEVAEPAAVAWDVLTDYAGIAEFVPDIRVSVVHERRGGRARVEQEAVSSFLMFSKRVHLLLEIEEGDNVIRFRDACGLSFAEYAGSWQLARKADRTHVTYQLRAKPTFDVPGFLVSRVLSRDAKAMVEHLRAEIARRARTRPDDDAAAALPAPPQGERP